MNELRISKMDAARRQLQTAISLYFDSADPVAIHTLTHAVFGILGDLCSQGESHQTLLDRMMEYVYEEKRSYLRGILNEAGNFFKHADRDPNVTLEFSPEFTEWLLFDCCSTYQSLSGETSPWSLAFLTWMSARNPEIFMEPMQSRARELSDSFPYTQMSRKEYFKSIWEGWRLRESQRNQ